LDDVQLKRQKIRQETFSKFQAESHINVQEFGDQVKRIEEQEEEERALKTKMKNRKRRL